MIKLFAHEDRFRVWQIKSMLEGNGIPCFVKNEYASGAIGDLSPFDCWPEIWLVDEQWDKRASALIEAFLNQAVMSSPWFCRKCKEQNEPAFELCWNCGTEVE